MDRAELAVADAPPRPVLGAAVLAVPFASLCTPGRPSRYDAFPFVVLAVLAAAAVVTGVLVVRHRGAGTPSP